MLPLDPQLTTHVTVVVTETLGLAKTDAINDTGVVQRVRDNSVLPGQDGFKDTGVSIEARSVKDGVLGAIELCQLLLKILVDIL